jgi:hypothetical protein
MYLLELCTAAHYQWQWNDGNTELILWKLSYIWMKILNDITCNLNWIQIQLKGNRIQIGAQGIENMLIPYIIHDSKKTHFHSIQSIFQTRIYFDTTRLVVEHKPPMLQLSLEFLSWQTDIPEPKIDNQITIYIASAPRARHWPKCDGGPKRDWDRLRPRSWYRLVLLKH